MARPAASEEVQPEAVFDLYNLTVRPLILQLLKKGSWRTRQESIRYESIQTHLKKPTVLMAV